MNNQNDITQETLVTATDLVTWHDLMTEFAQTDSYRADEALVAANGIARYLGNLVDVTEQGEI